MPSTPRDDGVGMTDVDAVAMEKELYEESIRVLEARLQDVENGTLPEFVNRCKEFEATKGRHIGIAKLHRDLLLQNIDELLQFDLQQIGDGYDAALEALSTNPPDIVEVEGPPPIEYPTTAETDTDAHLTDALAQSAMRKRIHFSLEHVQDILPTTETIQAQLQSLRDSVAAVHEKLAQAAHQECAYDSTNQTVQVGNLYLSIGDPVILTSEVAQEDFYGTIHRMNATAIHLVLVCGNHVQVALAVLRARKCRLRFQDSRKNLPLASPSPLGRKTTTGLTPRAKRSTTARKRLVSLI
ncbi:Aste57867_16418 [Aphanomyces stellatus]|uniref:Aste57867_16418 protein n=1 Tax=Aphanomyces stellatus TaxID=120398 RepID=A0A485L5E7_9STRA|nr:hypothetical protein As57867_016361 [Aphanomyces stellatus]VFT93193.1 Aste57867_16418 [Aphanomyces stellatus]